MNTEKINTEADTYIFPETELADEFLTQERKLGAKIVGRVIENPGN